MDFGELFCDFCFSEDARDSDCSGVMRPLEEAVPMMGSGGRGLLVRNRERKPDFGAGLPGEAGASSSEP